MEQQSNVRNLVRIQQVTRDWAWREGVGGSCTVLLTRYLLEPGVLMIGTKLSRIKILTVGDEVVHDTVPVCSISFSSKPRPGRRPRSQVLLCSQDSLPLPPEFSSPPCRWQLTRNGHVFIIVMVPLSAEKGNTILLMKVMCWDRVRWEFLGLVWLCLKTFRENTNF